MVEDISPRETWAALEADGTAQLIDVRTPAEWIFVGIPDVSGLERDLHTISWQLPGGTLNDRFVEDLRDAGIVEGQPLYFICRSGARSRSAAMMAAQAGFGPVYNVADGFEGPLDPAGHRGIVGGWKVADLPWRQS